MKHRYIFDKLVRSKAIHNAIENENLTFSYKLLDDEHYEKAILRKFKEECDEVCECLNKEEIVSELADVFEVIDAICTHFKVTKDEILQKQKERRDERGDLQSKEYANYVQMDENHAMSEYFANYAAKSGGRYPFREVLRHDISLLAALEDFQITNKDKSELKTSMQHGENFKTCIKRFCNELGFSEYKIIDLATDDFDEKTKIAESSFIIKVSKIADKDRFLLTRV